LRTLAFSGRVYAALIIGEPMRFALPNAA
jgi:hypothetical protein